MSNRRVASVQAVAPFNSTPVAINQARTLLQLADGNANNWTAFYTDQYLRTYPAVRDDLPDAAPASVLQCYLDRGQALGHSPNSFFEEAFFLASAGGMRHWSCDPLGVSWHTSGRADVSEA